MESLMKLQPLWLALSVAMLASASASPNRNRQAAGVVAMADRWRRFHRGNDVSCAGGCHPGQPRHRLRSVLRRHEPLGDSHKPAVCHDVVATYRPNHAYIWWFDLTAVAVDSARVQVVKITPLSRARCCGAGDFLFQRGPVVEQWRCGSHRVLRGHEFGWDCNTGRYEFTVENITPSGDVVVEFAASAVIRLRIDYYRQVGHPVLHL